LRYDANYYSHHCGGIPYDRTHPHWLHFFGNIADEIIRAFKPKRVLDVGCAKGFLVECLRDRGVEAYGFDISEYAIGEVRPDIRAYCWVASVTDSIEGYYDLVTNIEGLEHVTENEALRAIENMTGHASQILFSSTPCDFSEPTHQNVRPILWWLQRFAEHSFAPDLTFQADFVASWCFVTRQTKEQIPDDDLDLFARYLDLKLKIQKVETESAEASAKYQPAQVESERQRQQLAKELDIIKGSRSWKLVRRYWEWKARWLPEKSLPLRIYKRTKDAKKV